jgi:hypothetical protein
VSQKFSAHRVTRPAGQHRRELDRPDGQARTEDSAACGLGVAAVAGTCGQPTWLPVPSWIGKYAGVVGEFSEREDAGMARPPVGYLPYGDRKPYVVADTLAALKGPTHGVVSLPRHLDWSGRADYDLSRSTRLASMYKVVLSEAGSVDDLCTWIDGELLLRLWPTLWLPPQLRRRWEERFPELAAARTVAA